jgi:hypothetical protein
MSALSEVIAELRAALDTMAAARMHAVEAQARLADALTTFRLHTTGSSQPAVPQAIASFEAGITKVEEAIATFGQLEQLISHVLSNLTGAEPANSSADAPGPSTAEVGRRGSQLADGRARGVRIRQDGTTETLYSGDGPPWYETARAALATLGGPNGRKLARLARHVEVRLVFMLLAEIEAGDRPADQPVRETVVMDRPPCSAPPQPPTPFSCHYQLGNIIRAVLPSGSTLTVIDADGSMWVYPKETKR